jgi:hypothetical protein
MQDRYVGDIGDFGKFGLLRALFPCRDWRLGLVWYLVPNEVHNADGRHTEYLDKPAEFRGCDPDLFDKISRLVAIKPRTVAAINVATLFGPETVSFSERLSFQGISANSQAGRDRRKQVRKEWLGNAAKAIKDCQAVFLDPDNGLETASTRSYEKKGPKFSYFDEVAALASAERVCVIYHHLGRKSHKETIKRYVRQIEDRTNRRGLVSVLRFNRFSCRAYFILATETTRARVETARDRFLESSWSRCFERVV